MNLNNEMLYAMFMSSIKNMDDEELKNSLSKAKELLSEQDYSKLLELVKKERTV